MMEYPFKDLLPLDEVLEREGYYKDWTHLDPEVFYSLTQISEYIKTKAYGVDVRLLISQLAEHFWLRVTQITDAMAEFIDLNNQVGELITKSDQTKAKATNALNLSTSADALSKSVQEQFNQVVIDGDSSVEAAQARVDASGQTNPTLKARLDKEYNETLSKNPIYLTDYGVSHLESATVNTQLIQQAIVDAEYQSRPVILPWVPDGHWIDINDKIDISNGGVSITGFGKHSRIRQTAFPKEMFHVLAPNVEIKSFYPSGVDFDATGLLDTFVTYSAVVIEAEHVTVDDIYGDYLACIVNVIGRNMPLKGISVTNVESGENIVFNLLASNTQSLHYDNIRGSYRYMTGVGTPPHLIYFSQGFGDNYDLEGGRAYAYNGTGSFAFQYKGMRGGNAGTLYANNCQGSYHVMESSDFHCDEVEAIDDTWASELGQASFSFDSVTENRNITVDKVKIRMKGKGKPMLIGAPLVGCEIKELDLESKHIDNINGAYSADIDISGTDVKLINPKVKNIGAELVTASIGLRATASNVTISNPQTSGNINGIYVTEGAINTEIINYSPSKQTNFRTRGLLLFAPVKILEYSHSSERTNKLAEDKVFAVDEFLAAKYTSSGHEWIITGGAIRGDVSKGTLYTYGDLINGVSGWINTKTPNIELTAGIKYSFNEALIVRSLDRLNFLGGRISHNDNTVQLFSYDEGTLTILKSLAFTVQIGRRYKHKIVAFGDSLEYYIDGAKVISYTLTSEESAKYSGVTNHGIWGWGRQSGQYDSLEWASLS